MFNKFLKEIFIDPQTDWVFKKEESSCSNIEDMFLYYIKRTFTFKEMPSFSDNLIKRALEIANKATQTKKELYLVERRVEFVRINKEALEWVLKKVKQKV